MTTYIDVNCDMGESYGRWTLGNDEGVMPHITSANVACGFHGGDPHVMRKTVELALKHGVAIGAHPGLPDLMGFGRRRMEVSPQEIKDYHRYQVGALNAFVKASGATLQHVKAHGIQYHMFEENLDLGRASAEQVLELDPNLILMVMAMTKYDAEARKTKVRVAAEVFASGRASNYAKAEDSFAQPINCSTAQVDIRALEEDKVSKPTEAAAGVSYALPTTILMGAITGTGGATYDVGTGAYNQKIDER